MHEANNLHTVCEVSAYEATYSCGWKQPTPVVRDDAVESPKGWFWAARLAGSVQLSIVLISKLTS